MNFPKRTRHGESLLKLVPRGRSDDTKNIEPPSHGGGDDGGSGVDDLRKRVERTEDNITQIKIDLATLTERSENFASQAALDALIIRSETFATKEDLGNLRAEIHKQMGSIHKEISNQTKWIAATMIGIASATLAVAKYLLG